MSDYAAAEIAAVHGVAPSRIRVAVEAPAAEYFPGLRRPTWPRAAAAVGLVPARAWFTYVGGFSPHKRIDVILRAHAEVAGHRASAPHLLLIGRLSGDVFLTPVTALRALVASARHRRAGALDRLPA